MPTKIHLSRLILPLIICSGLALVVHAASEWDIVFPVAELGNCKDKQSCKAYCDREANFPSCIAFARKHNLLAKKDLDKAEKVTALPNRQGPGGCRGVNECHAYCEDTNHIEECIAFAKEHGLMEKRELEEAEKVARALRGGAKLPGGCTSKAQCEAYCQDETHIDECVEFGRRAGFISDKEVEMIKKTRGRGPGGCRGERECRAYCDNEGHIEECIAFAKEHGLMSENEARIAARTRGKGPGGCRGEECRDYCNDKNHFEECVAFAKEHGIISEEEYEQAKKTGGVGPGGCRGEEECRQYCQNPDNRGECEAFFINHGFAKKEGFQARDEGKRRLKEAFDKAPSEVKVCLDRELGQELARRIHNGEIEPGREIGEKVRACFEEFERRRGEEGERMMRPQHESEEGSRRLEPEVNEERRRQFDQGQNREQAPPEFRPEVRPDTRHDIREERREEFTPQEREPIRLQGPGGCSTPEECRRYCQDENHAEECRDFKSLQTQASVRLFGSFLFQTLQILLGR